LQVSRLQVAPTCRLKPAIFELTGARNSSSLKTPEQSEPKVAAVIAAGGTGARMGAARPKQFLPLAGRPIMLRAIDCILSVQNLLEVVIALPSEHLAEAGPLLAQLQSQTPLTCIEGGKTRQASVARAVASLPLDAELILVHDAVRPLCPPDLVHRTLRAAWETGAAVPGISATDTIKRVSRRGRILATPPREELYAIQTPQCFRADILRSALEQAAEAGFVGTDESSVVRWAGHPVAVVEGEPANIKITRPLDALMAELLVSGGSSLAASAVAAAREAKMRIGHGVDYHRLVEGRKLILGGIEIPFEKGLEGHSDADALTHAICDALLGAAGLGDIGRHFPDDAACNRNRCSLEFLREVGAKIQDAGWTVDNVDATLLAQQPRLAPYMPAMKANIARCLELGGDAINIKATTTEGMNAEGRGEGISAQAVVLLRARS
jgi:2-C-methyl-D-erythritol 4-phosphate cytidylyltransferase/2-C-methyl-D-erythritol 2,4-cyclodiphosphate synthase